MSAPSGHFHALGFLPVREVSIRKLEHWAIVLVVFSVGLFWFTQAQPQTQTVNIFQPQVIYATTTTTTTIPDPIPVEHDLPAPVEYAIDLDRFRDQLVEGITWPPNMELEEWLLEENRPVAPPHAPLVNRPANPIPPEQVEALLAASFLEPDMPWARRVSFCESGWNSNAKNRSSTAAGMFQFLRGTWNWVAGVLGFGDYDSGAVYDASLNVQAAAWLYYNEGPSHWVCK